MKKSINGLAVAVLLTVPAASASAALNAYLRIEGSKTKSFTPDAPSGLQRVMLPESVHRMLNNKYPEGMKHEIVSPRDPQSGQATGRRTYEPIVFHKRIDKASPLLAKAVAAGEHLPKVTLLLYRNLPGNMVEFFAEVTLTDCMMRQYDKATPKLFEKPVKGRVVGGGDADDRPMESLSLNFTKIEWRSISGKQGALDYPVKASFDVKKNKGG
jgi:type VI secretion system secreted protein Hcp